MAAAAVTRIAKVDRKETTTTRATERERAKGAMLHGGVQRLLACLNFSLSPRGTEGRRRRK
jgi:hypothetical protein